MAIVKCKPTSPGRRFVIRVKPEGLHKGDPYEPLVAKLTKSGGRNNAGRISTRHRGGGHKRRYRIIDFRRDKLGVPGKVERLEYDPNRTAHIALILYKDGERRYIIAPKNLQVGQEIISDKEVPVKIGNCMPLRNIPVGTQLHCIELKPGKGAQLARSAGATAQLLAKEGIHATLRLRSGEMRKVHIDCKAVIGEVSNAEHNLSSLGKAGASRWRGRRPTVRGIAMNPVDHPHGGGEGRNKGKHPTSPWGQPTKGYKTRRNKRTDNMIVRRRKAK
ncbi:MAG: 50S ribosomal protein L2 [Methylothermaceae bacteria B42]|nr:MAG: 50S ribosomal protein L2 [Methylothermaceae bacteria B42]HHJ40044.1 50S ribosomal protein L2 [Methylothermaceae bacterium]